jgi:hypothetical protein
MSDLLELYLLAKATGNTDAIAQNTALASMPEYVKEAHFIARHLFDEKVNAPRPEWTSGYGAGIKLAWIAAIVVLFIYSVAAGAEWAFVLAILTVFGGAAFAWAAVSAKENEFKQRAAAEAHDQAWEIVNSKLAKEDAVRNAMFDAAVSRRA